MDVQTSILLIIGVCIAGIVFFAYLKIYLFVRYRRLHDQAMREAEARAVRETEARQQLQENQHDQEESRRRGQVLFLMHQEQVRRLIDAKIDVVRTLAAAQARLTTVRAELIQRHSEILLRIAETGQGDGSAASTALAEAHNQLALILEQHQQLKADAEQRLATIEAEMRALPGTSGEGWVAAVYSENAAMP